MILSISRIKLFKACRRAYELKYIEGLEPVQTSDALETGLWLHDILEILNKEGNLLSLEEDYSKEKAMAVAYQKYIYPQFKVAKAEEWVEYKLGNDKLVGRVDGIAEDGRLVEYKTTSMDLQEEYEYNLQWDEQLLAYMLMTGTREMYYVVVKKPTIRQKKTESEEEFFQRMVAWYDEDTDSKIKLMVISRTDEEVAEFEHELRQIAFEMNHATNLYRNTNHCRCWGRRCEYSPVCLHYDPEQEYIEFTKREV